MKKAIKCELCKILQECKRYDVVEFATYLTENDDDWQVHKTYNICKKCKQKIMRFIENLKKR